MANTAFNPSDKSASVALTGSNLIATSSATLQWGRAVDRQVAGKFYWEVTATTFAITSSGIGIASTAANLSVGFSSTVAPWTCAILRSGLIYVDSVYTNITLGTITSGTVVCIAVDLTNRRIWFRLGAAGNWNNNAANNPATGVGGISHSIGAGIPAQPAFHLNGNLEAITANFGDAAFVGAVPSGFTSGFTAGASVPTNAIASQALAEHWLTTNPDARITQVALEHWASVTSDNLQAVVTQVLLEHWMSVDAPVVPPVVSSNGPIITMIH